MWRKGSATRLLASQAAEWDDERSPVAAGLGPRPAKAIIGLIAGSRARLLPHHIGRAMGVCKPCPGCCGKGPADRHQAIVDQAEEKLLPLCAQARNGCLGDPPAPMNLRSQLRVEQRYRIGHPHQYQRAPSDRVDAKIVIFGFESDYVAAYPRRQSA